ncbi:MAG: tetratricopeptide repeat protein [Nitrospirae bacterium]|nr:tetratricopeptide repeat protein [Nitrospirota bacterium]
MRSIILAALIVMVCFSLSMADDAVVKKAYGLYYQGKSQAAIKLADDYVKDHPDPGALYFLGYAYYEAKKMDIARKYFKEAYLIDPNFSPVVPKKGK